MAFTTWRDTVAELLRGVHWSQNTWGERITGLLALNQDALSEGLGEAVRAPWLLEETSPNDALQYAGRDRNMPRYPYETDTQYRARLMTAWDSWPLAGTRQVLVDQFAALGLTIELYDHGEWPRPPVNHPVTDTIWWSKFTVFLTDGTGWGPSPICGADFLACGSGVYGYSGELCGGGATSGDGSLCGDAGFWAGDHLCGVTGDVNLIAAMRGIVRKWKAAHEVCLEAVIEDGPICGDGSLANDGSLCGGGTIVVSMV